MRSCNSVLSLCRRCQFLLPSSFHHKKQKQTHTQIHIHRHKHSHKHTPTLCPPLSLSLYVSLSDTHTHTHTHTQTQTHTHKNTGTKTQKHTQDASTHPLAQSLTHTHTYAHTQTHTHSYVHTHTQKLSLSLFLCFHSFRRDISWFPLSALTHSSSCESVFQMVLMMCVFSQDSHNKQGLWLLELQFPHQSWIVFEDGSHWAAESHDGRREGQVVVSPST